MGFNIRLLKAFSSYAIFTWLGYRFVFGELGEAHLTDLAFEYKYHFKAKMHSPIDTLYEQLWQERIKNTKADEVV